MKMTRSLSFTGLALLFSLGASVSIAGDAASEETEFKNSMLLQDYTTITYKSEAGEVLTYSDFMTQFRAGKKTISIMKNPNTHAAIVTMKAIGTEPIAKTKPLSVAVGGALPKMDLLDTNGVKHRWKSFKGKPVLLSFFYTECAPCVAEIPALNEFAKTDNRVGALAVTFDDADAVKKFVAKYHLEWPVVADAKNFTDEIGIEAYPTMLLVSADGKLLGSKSGGIIKSGQNKAQTAEIQAWVSEVLRARR